MSLLIVLIPPRARLQAGAAEPAPAGAAGEFSYVVAGSDGLSVSAQGRCAPALLPKATSVVAVLADADVSWQRAALPRAPAARLRAALIGVLEEALLDEPDALHFALAPGATPGQPSWIAVTHKAWLQGHIATLERSGVPLARVLPSSWPDLPPQGHFAQARDAREPLSLTWSDPNSVLQLRLQGSYARALLPQWTEMTPRWSATPAAAAAAEAWLGAPVQVQSDEERALQAARSPWNLRQFDLAPQRRGTLALREGLRQFLSPAWRPVRWGLVALALLQVVGLNLWAWRQHGELRARQVAMTELLKTAHPQVRAVLDAPLQMQRETELLRIAAGKPGETDLEPLLHAAAAAWPEGLPPVPSLRFEPGRLSFPATGWTTAQIEQFRNQLKPIGYAAEANNGAISVTRGAS